MPFVKVIWSHLIFIFRLNFWNILENQREQNIEPHPASDGEGSQRRPLNGAKERMRVFSLAHDVLEFPSNASPYKIEMTDIISGGGDEIRVFVFV